MLDNNQDQTLLIGPALWRLGEGWHDQLPVLAVNLLRPRPVAGYGALSADAVDNTIIVPWSALTGAPAVVSAPDSTVAVSANGPLFDGLTPTATLHALAPRAWAGQVPAPLFLLGRSDDTIVIHTPVRIGDQNGLFVRAATLPAPASAPELPALLRAAMHAVGRHREFLSNHECSYRTFWPNDELEHKITLDVPVDLHAILLGLRGIVGSALLSRTIWEYRDDYQVWDFLNHMYEVHGGAEEAGYISFIPDSAGTTIVKRKWMVRDGQFQRREQRWRGVDLPDSPTRYDDYVATHVRSAARFLGTFRRTRLDSTCEFVRTGNIYGIMVDWCRSPDSLDAPHLYQVELEYMRSRTLDGDARHAIADELRVLVEATRTYLTQQDIPHTYPGESKLTYMRAIAEREAA